MTLHRLIFVIACLSSILGSTSASADKIQLVAGGGTGGDGGPAKQARLVSPFGVGSDAAGNLYVVEMAGGERVRKIDTHGVITTVVGTGETGYSGDGGPAIKARMNGAHHLLVLPNGDILLADTWNNCVRRIDHQSGIITTIAGTGEKGFSGDGGPATQAKFGGIYCLALSPELDRLYVCDLDNRRIRAVDMKTGIVTTAAGNGDKGVPEDGHDAAASPLADPRGVAVDSRGSLYILERGGNALRVVYTDGKIQTVIGLPNHGLPPDIGSLSGPKHLAIDRAENVLIADTENHRILKYNVSTKRTRRIAGTGRASAKGSAASAGVGGPAGKLNLNQPHGVFPAADGSFYIADSTNGRVIHVRP